MILVDNLTPDIKTGKLLCHMASDKSTAELHNFARRIGIKRRWFQEDKTNPHYDITEFVRKVAIRRGAVVVTGQEMVKRCREGGVWPVPKLRGLNPTAVYVDDPWE